jgi:uncharacterized protein YkwD
MKWTKGSEMSLVGGLNFSAGMENGARMATTTSPVLSYTSPAATGGGNIPAPERRSQLLAGASPATQAERDWTQKAEGALRGYVATVQKMVAEGTRQAKLGNDIYGRPLQVAEDSSYEQRVLQLVNGERARAGLGALGYDRRLDQAAERHNQQQAATRTMAHEGIGDGDPGSRIRAAGFTGAWGENVAAGQLTPEQVVAEWMASPGHRRNILDPTYSRLGVSYNTSSDGRTYWAQSFGA